MNQPLPSRRPTILDVARAARVSPATVSYVLSGNRPIGAQTRQRVNRVIQELGYQPNNHARALKSNKHRTISVIVEDFVEDFVFPIIRGVEAYAAEQEYALVVATSALFGYDFRETVEFARNRGVDGLIYVSGISNHEAFEQVEGIDVPQVGLNRPAPADAPTILCDNSGGGRRAAEHLVEAGATTLAIIAGPQDRDAAEDRLRGFREYLAQREMPLPDSRVFYGSFDTPSGHTALHALLDLEPQIDGVFCANDDMAAGAMNAALERGVAVPDDLKVVGFDNQKFTAFWPTPISTFSLPMEQMGRMGANALFSALAGTDVGYSRMYVRSTLVPRASTGWL